MNVGGSLPKVRCAGVIPYTIMANKTVWFLLGRESYVPNWKESEKWGIFGGRVETSDGSPEHGAARECYQETAGCVFSYAEIRNALQDGKYALSVHMVFTKSRSVYYFVPVEYEDYPAMFRKSKQFAQYCGGKTDCIEKTQVKWYSRKTLYAELDGFISRRKYRKKFSDLFAVIRKHSLEDYLQAYENGKTAKRVDACCAKTGETVVHVKNMLY